MTDRTVLYGIGVSSGTASGPVAVVTPAIGIDEHEQPCTDPDADGERVVAVLEEVSASLTARAEHANSETSKAVLEATAALAKDREP